MESYLNPVILIPILLFGVGSLLYYFYHKLGKKYPRKKRDESATTEIEEPNTEETESEFSSIYAMVLDNTDPVAGRWYWDLIPGVIVKHILQVHETLGIQHDTEDGKKAHILVKSLDPSNLEKKMDITYSPIKIPILRDDSPVELNYDTEHPEYEIILSKLLSEEKNFMQKYGQVLWWAAVIGFIIFMMVSG